MAHLLKKTLIMKTLLLILFSVQFVQVCNAQNEILGETSEAPINLERKYRSTIFKGDTIAVVDLKTAVVTGARVFKDAEAEKKYRKLVRDVKKAYPYAKIAGQRIQEYHDLVADKKNRERRKLMREAEKNLKVEFKKDLENLTVNQGKILMKLIDRETGNSSYDLVKEYRGKMTAFFWQSFAVIYDDDLNMKVRYDKDGDDRIIEEIIGMIDRKEI
jgi:ribosomal protein L13